VALLRELGYKTFDGTIDHSYDTVADNTERYHRVRAELDRLNGLDLHAVYVACRSDILHNQELFLAYKTARLAELQERLTQNTV
jgi:hypothetical protein